MKYQKVFRFAEELKSGKFKPVNKDVNLLPPAGQETDQIQPGAPIDNMEAEREMIKNQLYWIGAMKSFFFCTLGL